MHPRPSNSAAAAFLSTKWWAIALSRALCCITSIRWFRYISEECRCWTISFFVSLSTLIWTQTIIADHSSSHKVERGKQRCLTTPWYYLQNFLHTSNFYVVLQKNMYSMSRGGQPSLQGKSTLLLLSGPAHWSRDNNLIPSPPPWWEVMWTSICSWQGHHTCDVVHKKFLIKIRDSFKSFPADCSFPEYLFACLLSSRP